MKLNKINYFDDRFYEIVDKDGQVLYYPSVTTILKAMAKPDYLNNWRDSIGGYFANIIMHKAAERGTKIHSMIEHLNTGGSVSLAEDPDSIVIDDMDLANNVYRYVQFIELLQPEIIFPEINVYSNKYQFAGTLDIILKIKEGEYSFNNKPQFITGGWYVADIKTGSGISDDYYMQLGAYAQAYKEMNPKFKISGTMIIHTNAQTRTGIEGLKVITRTSEEMKQDFKNFLKVHEVYKLKPAKPILYNIPNKLQLNLKEN